MTSRPKPKRPRAAASAGALRILVVDDHPIVRLGIRQMIGGEADLEICGEAGSAEVALQLASRR